MIRRDRRITSDILGIVLRVLIHSGVEALVLSVLSRVVCLPHLLVWLCVDYFLLDLPLVLKVLMLERHDQVGVVVVSELLELLRGHWPEISVAITVVLRHTDESLVGFHVGESVVDRLLGCIVIPVKFPGAWELLLLLPWLTDII